MKNIRIKILLTFAGVFFSLNSGLFAQGNLYIPLNIQKAYQNNTRNFDGTPGENYWQNSSNYKIKVSIEPETRLVSGEESITYYNNSPDTLKKIAFRLYQNMNKPGSPRDYPLDPKLLTKGVRINRLSVRGNEIDVDTSSRIVISVTNLFVKLNSPLVPNSSINLEFDWSFTIPNGKHWRMGTIDPSTFFIAYWYPQVSVYDDIQGWNTYNYTGQGEFYNDFSNFDVEITVPNTFSVWATGVLQNPEEILNEKYLKRYQEAHVSDEVIKIISKDDLEKQIYNAENETNTWDYKAEYVTDFAFGISDHYLWDGVSLAVDEETGRRVYIAAAYNKKSRDFYDAALVARKSIKYFSEDFPDIPFPFPCLTDFNGTSGGMEFPMIINDESRENYNDLVSLTSHEIAHSYFPFYMGINERKYAWMDEGMATFIPMKFQIEEGKKSVIERNVSRYEEFAGYETEMPLMTPSFMLIGTPYRNASYRKPGLAYYYLRNVLGKEKFDKAFKEYIKRWNGKHPMPYDFFFTFEDATGKGLNWFWKPWFFNKGFPDLAIDYVQKDEDDIRISIEKVGKVPVPVYVKIAGEDDSKVVEKTAAVWKDGKDKIWITEEIDFVPVSIELGNSKIPDVDKSNNSYEMKESPMNN